MTIMTRRGALGAAFGAGLAAGPLQAAASPLPFFEREKRAIGIQLYTLSDMLGASLEDALAAIAGIGYTAVEIPSYMGWPPADLRRLLDRYGLSCTAAHVQMREGSRAEPGLLGNIYRLAEHMATLGATHVYAPSMAIPDDIGISPAPNEGYRFIVRAAAAMGEDGWKRMAGRLSDIGRQLKAEGLAFGYHNHNFEFVRAGERSGYDILLDETDPDAVSFELDVGWAAAAGADVEDLLIRRAGRFSALHVKDLKASTRPNTALAMDPADVGSGAVDWRKVIAAAHAGGVTGYFLEQEPPFALPRLEAVRRGYDYLAKLEI
jgi:sugar phosphate isomerase/epimerase